MTQTPDDFQQLFGEPVTPLKTPSRVSLAKSKVDDASQAIRRAQASEEAPVLDPLAGEPIEWLSPLDLLCFMRPGVQKGVFRNLRLGHYALDARLDLHNMSLDQARQSLYQFIQDCLKHEVRTALITHGKGEGRDQPAKLKSAVNYWLPQIPEVLAFHTAQKQHGSYGATYVLLKKSDQQKLRNREQFSCR